MTSVRRSARARTIGAGLAAVALAAGAVSCSKGDAEGAAGDSPKMTPAAAVAKAAKNSDDITSLRYRMTGEVPEQGRVKAEAAMRMKPDVAMSMKMTALDQGADGSAEIRLVDKAMYIGGNAEMAKEMDGKSWMKFDLSALGDDALGGGAPGAGQAEQNPATESTFLTGAEDVKKLGSEKVDGVETTHYRGTVTLDTLRDSFKDEDKETREKREKSLKQYEDMGVDEMTMDMWIDGDDHTKQFRMKGEADKGRLDLTITFLDYNKPVTIKAPPAKDTMDLAEMMNDLESS
ncbi:putative lipoprotein [Streptomyces davaonensis JCM 4913]|uniref:Putative lipoprotein n=1 Tax=Streptomyces davaonensis (strain DSM 101723 / JCM 4913 / KCC S-0913 / 768) TaxID=1214101 RepID=K4QVJ6_STRDJ|nr:lipoprotein [Streptomyces davaonensis]CCK28121.1 putative lipoprotein [Streptomyces davaonensis JCM 4913]